MADVSAAIDYMLKFEDADLSGVITSDAGGKTRYGIASKYHPELLNCLFYTTMGSIAALAIARGIYAQQYADPLAIAEIANQDIANKVLSLGVNIGIVPASKLLQRAIGMFHVDGCIGVETLMTLSKREPLSVLADLRAEASRYYTQVAASNPDDEIYLHGWLRRANA